MTTPLSDIGGLRSILPKIIPNWLANRIGKNAGFRFLWVLAVTCDFFIQAMLEGFRAALPGVGTDTALTAIGQARGLVQGLSESNASFTQRLINYIAIAKTQGKQIGIVTQLQAYLPTPTPKVSVINRAGVWTTIDSSGVVTTGKTTFWDWDSVSTPYRSGYWSDEWVIVSTQPWAKRKAHFGDGLTFGRDGFGITHLVPRDAYNGTLTVLNQFKAAHSNIRSVIYGASGVDFGNPVTLPDGKWGKWGLLTNVFGTTFYEASDRNLLSDIFWDPTIPDGVTIL